MRAMLDGVAGEDARIVITGASSGIGFELAEQFSLDPRVSLLLGSCEGDRCTSRSGRVGDRARALRPCPARRCVAPLDLLDLDSVQRFALEAHEFLLNGGPGLRLLINNAGLKQTPGGKTKFDISPTWQVNFLGPFLLTELLAGHREAASAQARAAMRRTGSGPWPPPSTTALRVVQVASGRENESLLDQATMEAAVRAEPSGTEYADSKRALLLWTSVRAQSLALRGDVFVHAANPGRIDTRLGLYWLPEWAWRLSKWYRMVRYRTVAEGALAVAAPGLHRQAAGKFGHYSSGERMLEDLVVWRMPDKKLSVQLVRWASQATALSARAGGRPLSETGRPLSLTDLQAMAPVEEDMWSTQERRLHHGTSRPD